MAGRTAAARRRGRPRGSSRPGAPRQRGPRGSESAGTGCRSRRRPGGRSPPGRHPRPGWQRPARPHPAGAGICAFHARNPFGWATTADEAIAGIRLDGTRAIVTGASSGIGTETARVLAAAGAEVTLGGLSAVRGHRAGRSRYRRPGPRVRLVRARPRSCRPALGAVGESRVVTAAVVPAGPGRGRKMPGRGGDVRRPGPRYADGGGAGTGLTAEGAGCRERGSACGTSTSSPRTRTGSLPSP